MAEPIIQLADIRKAYGTGAGRQQVLRGVSLDVAEGEMLAMVGESGSGKSTLLNIMGGLDQPDEGTVHVDGHDYAKLSDRDLAMMRNRRIGFVFQQFHLLDHLSVLENVALPAFFATQLSDVEQAAVDALTRVGLGEFVDRRPSELSGGQKQRVAIARALFSKPAILLCDEPTGNLDSQTGREVIEFFQQINEDDGTTLIIVTHEERVSRAAQRVIRIADGQLLEHGSGSAELTG